MKTNIFIPNKIKVGYQHRDSMFTEKLAYVIYYDEKNVLRKENSWNGWIDKSIEPNDYENTPMSGFILNKKVGDYNTGWNHRKAYLRMYDPRGFEFEISVENLLYILENTNSIKGKCLEGEFVYGWDGSKLVLIPTSSPDYIELKDFNILRHTEKITVNDLIVGGRYLTKSKIEMIYMGKHPYHEILDAGYKIDDITYQKPSNRYWFLYARDNYNVFEAYSSIYGKFLKQISIESDTDFSKYLEKLHKHYKFSPLESNKTICEDYSYDEFMKKINDELINHYNNRDLTSSFYEKRTSFYSEKNKRFNVTIYYRKYMTPETKFVINLVESGYYYHPIYETDSIDEFNTKLSEIFHSYKPKKYKTYLANGNLCKEY